MKMQLFYFNIIIFRLLFGTGVIVILSSSLLISKKIEYLFYIIINK